MQEEIKGVHLHTKTQVFLLLKFNFEYKGMLKFIEKFTIYFTTNLIDYELIFSRGYIEFKKKCERDDHLVGIRIRVS